MACGMSLYLPAVVSEGMCEGATQAHVHHDRCNTPIFCAAHTVRFLVARLSLLRTVACMSMRHQLQAVSKCSGEAATFLVAFNVCALMQEHIGNLKK